MYIIRCTPEEIELLEQNGIDFILSNIMDLFNNAETTEIESVYSPGDSIIYFDKVEEIDPVWLQEYAKKKLKISA